MFILNIQYFKVSRIYTCDWSKIADSMNFMYFSFLPKFNKNKNKQISENGRNYPGGHKFCEFSGRQLESVRESVFKHLHAHVCTYTHTDIHTQPETGREDYDKDKSHAF